MAPCCVQLNNTVKEFTILLIQVLHVSHPSALEGSTRYARELVERFFREHTDIDVRNIETHDHKFRNLSVNSRLEIAFVGKPRRYKVPYYTIYKYEHSEGLAVVFEIETRLIKRFIPLHCEFDILEVERTDFLPLVGCTQRQMTDMRVSYMNV